MEAHLRDQVADGFGQAGIAVVRIAGADHGDDGEAADLAHDAVILAGGWRAELKDRPRGSADLPRGSAHLPRGSSDSPPGSAHSSRGATDLPRGSSRWPRGSVDLPRGSADLI